MAEATRPEARQDTTQERWTRYTTTVLVICGLAWAFDTFESTILSIATPAIMAEFGISRGEIGVLRTGIGLVQFVGYLGIVPLADKFGRRITLAASVLGYSVLTAVTGLTQNLAQFSAIAGLTRVPLAAVGGLAPVMATEQAPARRRAFAQGVAAAGYPFGFLLCSFVSIWVMPTLGWRAMYFIGIVPAVLVVFILRTIKDSPKFQLVKDDKWRKGERTKVGWIPLIRRYPKETAIGGVGVVCQLLPWTAWAAWVPTYLSLERGLGAGVTGTFLTIWMAGGIVGYLGVGWLMDRFGRRVIFPVFVFTGATLLSFYGLVTVPVAVLVIGTLINSSLVGLYGGGIDYFLEMFPTEVRGTAAGLLFAASALFGAPALLLGGFMPSIGASWPVIAIPYWILGLMFVFVLKENIGRDLINSVGERLGDR